MTSRLYSTAPIICTFICSFALLCACTSVNSQFYRLFPVFDSLLLFIIRCRCCCCCCWPLSLLSFFLCYWNAHAYQSLRRLLSSSTRRLLWLLAAVAVAVVCLVFQHLKSNSYTNKQTNTHKENRLNFLFIANIPSVIPFECIVDIHLIPFIHSFAFECVDFVTIFSLSSSLLLLPSSSRSIFKLISIKLHLSHCTLRSIDAPIQFCEERKWRK